jgi:HEAT repeat protein
MPLFGRTDVEKLKAKRDVNGLVKALRQNDLYVRLRAAEALGELGDARAAEPLAAILLNGAPEVREVAQAVIEARQNNREAGREARVVHEAMRTVLEESLDDLQAESHLAAVTSDDPAKWVRARADEDKRRGFDSRGAEPVLVFMMDDGVRQAAARALGKLGDPRAVEPLVFALEDRNDHLRKDAIDALGKLGDPRAILPLIAAVRGEGADEIRGSSDYATAALAGFGEAAAEPLLAAFKDETAPRARLLLAWTLGKLGDRRAVEPLIAALNEKEKLVRQGAAEALGKLGDGRALEPLIAALADEEENVRKRASEALESIGGPEAQRALAEYREKQG